MPISRALQFFPFSLVCLLATIGGPLRGEVVLAPLFRDHAVLQRNKPVPVWGNAAPGEEVNVRFAGQVVRTKAAADGRWQLVLQPLAASTEPSEMLILGTNRVVVRDVLVGDVWLCSGQSNMAWSVGASANPDLEIAGARWPLIRHIKIALSVSEVPEENAEGKWQVCSPCTVATFTAVGYYFAREMHRELGIPIGIVNSSVGGSAIEPWLSRAALASDPAFAVVSERWKRVVAAADAARTLEYERDLAAWRDSVVRADVVRDGNVPHARPVPPLGPGHFSQPSGLYNGMIAPLVPYGLCGFLWYQGAANAARAGEYGRLFTTLINSWRTVFRQGDLPFYFVQQPNYIPKDPTNMTWAEIREAQESALALPSTGMAVTIDIGQPENIHPYNKQDVGRRLALLAKARTHGVNVDDSGPRFQRVVKRVDGVHVEFAGAERGLEARGPLLGFELAGADGKFVPASAKIERDEVLVWSVAVPQPERVRFAWSNNPPASLFEKGGLPAAPFRAEVSPVP